MSAESHRSSGTACRLNNTPPYDDKASEAKHTKRFSKP